MDPEKLNRESQGRGRWGELKRGREANHKRLLNTENRLRVEGSGEEGKVGDRHGGGHLLG